VFGVLLALSTSTFEYTVEMWSPSLHEVCYTQKKAENVLERLRLFDTYARAENGFTVPLTPFQLTTPTAVMSPTVTSTSPPLTATTSLSLTRSTNLTSVPTTINSQVAAETPDPEVVPAIATRPARKAASPKEDIPTIASQPITATVAAASVTQLTISTKDVSATTATLEAEAQPPTTYTARINVPTGSLLNRLTYNKPGIWGSKAFYIGLAIVYVVLLVLFFRLLIQLGQQPDEYGKADDRQQD